jgi:hypothetical protein
MLKKVLNFGEELTSRSLGEVCSNHNAKVFAKVRVADILPIEGSGIGDSDYSFALKAHFDFIVADDTHDPLFVVEFDGPSHQNKVQIDRDNRKDDLCDRFDLPILRINANFLKRKYREMNVLGWYVNMWFAYKAFEGLQAEGKIPMDEYPDPTFFSSIPGTNRGFPLMLSAAVKGRIQKLYFQGRVNERPGKKVIHDMSPSFTGGRDAQGNYRALGWLMVSADAGVLARTGVRQQKFPVPEWLALRELTPFAVEDQLNRALSGEITLTDFRTMEKQIQEFKKQIKIVVGESFSNSTSLLTVS